MSGAPHRAAAPRGPAEAVEAIVVGGMDYGEADRIVRLLSPTLGRMSALARRARSGNRKFGGALEAGNRVRLLARPGHGDLYHIDEAELLDGRLGARSELFRLSTLAYCCEVAAALAREAQPEPRLWGLLEMALSVLDALEGAPSPMFRLGFEAKALTFAGLAPVLDRCARCDRPLEDALGVSLLAGGAVHLDCDPQAQPVTPAWLAAVAQARRTPLRDLVDLPTPGGPRWALAEAVETHTERALKSRALLAELEPAPPEG
jgi:DNA repair protein RecO (recombination protein O)